MKIMDTRAFFLFFNIWKCAQGYLNKHTENPLPLLSVKSRIHSHFLCLLLGILVCFQTFLMFDYRYAMHDKAFWSSHVVGPKHSTRGISGRSATTRTHFPGYKKWWTSGVSSSDKELNQYNSIIGAGIALLPFH